MPKLVPETHVVSARKVWLVGLHHRLLGPVVCVVDVRRSLAPGRHFPDPCTSLGPAQQLCRLVVSCLEYSLLHQSLALGAGTDRSSQHPRLPAFRRAMRVVRVNLALANAEDVHCVCERCEPCQVKARKR